MNKPYDLKVMNLQLFAEMGVDDASASEGAADLGSNVGSDSQQGNIQSQSEVATQGEDKTEIAFAKRLAAEREKLSAEIEGKYTPYKSILEEAAKSYGFDTVDEYIEAYNNQQQQKALEEQAQQYGASPEIIKELNELKAKITEKEQAELKAKEAQEREAWEKETDSKVNEVLELSKKDGLNITKEQLIETMMNEGVSDPKKAYKLMKPDVDVEALKKSAVEEYFAKLKGTYKPVEGGGSTPVVVQSQPKTFKDARNGARELIKGLFEN